MKQHVAVEAISIALQIKQSILLWGDPGIGKSKMVEAIGKAFNVPVEVVIASLREPSDFAGLPFIQDGEVSLAPPNWARRLAASGEGILFLDEISTAAPAVQAALLRVVEERVVGDIVLPDGISVIAAANPVTSGAGAWELEAPMANRFIHLDWPTDVEAFRDGIVSGWKTHQFVRKVPENWRDQRPQFAALVAAFTNAMPGRAYAMPTDPSATGKAWPSFRTWDKAIDLAAACRSARASEPVASALLSGAIGPAAAQEFLTFMKNLDLPDPAKVLENPEQFSLPRDRQDRAYAIVMSIVSYVQANPTTERWTKGLRAIVVAADASQTDLVAAAVKHLIPIRPEGSTLPPEAEKVLPVLRQAGIY